jgi:hypothetical protein
MNETSTWYEDLSEVVHNWVNPKEKSWGCGYIEDAGDGSGDGILTFPEGMCDELGWKAGDTLKLELSDEGTIIISKML